MNNRKEINRKPIFAAYLNMARQNAYLTLMHISKLMGVEETENKENKLYDMKVIKELENRKGETKNERTLKIIKLLHKHFPFLNAMIAAERNHKSYDHSIGLDNEPLDGYGGDIQEKEYATPIEYYKILEVVFKLLNALRNEYTHHSPIENDPNNGEIQKIMVKYLYNCMDGGRKVIKTRFKYTEYDMKFLTGSDDDRDLKVPPRYTVEKKFNPNNPQKPKKKYIEKEDFAYRLKDRNERLSPMGVFFFTCLFLHKKHSSMFFDKMEAYRPGGSEKEKKMIRETFCVYRIRLPKERIDSQRSEYALGMDMLNELQKCPPELFETFCKKDQDIFRVKSAYDEEGEETDNEEVLLLRYMDRFPYFALRYLDENEVFNKIRFQVALGHYRYVFRDKRCIDTTESDRVRSLQKEINGFGRLNEIEMERKNQWKDHIRSIDKVRKDKAGDPPYITDHYATYVFNGNRIGILFNDATRHDLKKKERVSLSLPDLKFDSSLMGKDARCVPPACWLSVYELPALIFHHLLCKDSRTEDLIIKCVHDYHRLFTDIQSGKLLSKTIFAQWKGERLSGPKGQKTLNEAARNYLNDFLYKEYQVYLKDLPKKLIDYLSDKSVNIDARFEKLARERVEKMLDGTRVRLRMFMEERNMIGDKDNKFGKDSYVDIRPGSLSLYLAKDLLLFQNNNDKITGLNYQVLQSSLAIYDKTGDEFRRLFVQANLLGQSKELNHPFLQDVLDQKPRNTLDFYQIYLQEKVRHLEKLLKDQKSLYDATFLHRSTRKRWEKRSGDYYKELAGRYIEEIFPDGTNFKSIELPRGLFEKAIKSVLKEKYGNPASEYYNESFNKALTAERANVTYLISQYVEHILKDSNQPFYHPGNGVYTRTYKFFNIIENKKVRNKLEEHFFSVEEMEEKIEKDVSGNRPIDRGIENYLAFVEREERNNAGNRSFGAKNKEAPDSKREIAERRLNKYLAEYKENEKAIRRYKVQDILIFLMAKELLLEKNASDKETVMGISEVAETPGRQRMVDQDSLDKIKQYKLQNVSPDQNREGNILSIPIPFYVTLNLNGTKITIYQSALKLKNYGDFFGFIYDERIRTLLPQVEEVDIDRKVLEDELDGYDAERIAIFERSHTLEDSVLHKHPELNDANACYTVETKNGSKQLPINNNFKEIMKTLGNLIQEEDLDIIVDIRNAFSHNHYTNNLNLTGMALPTVARSISKIFDKLVEWYK